MAIKQVQETLGQYEDWKFFSILESKNESDDDSKLEAEDEKDGLDVIKKLQDNLERFKSAAGDKILKYKEFWEENQKATDGFDEEGDLYKLWDSDYVVGVLNLPDEALSDEELEAEMAEVDGAVELEDDEEEVEDKEEGEDAEEDVEEEEEDEEDEEDKGMKPAEGIQAEDEEELEEGNAFSGALKKAKKEGKKEFKVGGKKYPVKESLIPEGEDFPLFEAEDEEGELPSEDVITPDEETPEEKEETNDQEGFQGFEEPGEEGEEDESDEFSSDDEVEVEDGEAVELDGDLDGDGEEEGGMEFAGEPGESQYLVVYNINGGREEVFRCSSPKAIEEFKDFFENQFKAAVREQIQRFKQAQEEKKAEEERKAKEAIRAERKSKLDKFMKA
jgi:hypothetical protein